MCTCNAPEIPPAILACILSLGIPLPAKNCAPPLLNCIITGDLTFAAVSNVALTELVPITLTAGNANWLSFASLYNASNSAPNKTPGLYLLISNLFFCKCKKLWRMGNREGAVVNRQWVMDNV